MRRAAASTSTSRTTAGDTVVARFRRSANPLIADPVSRFDLRWGGAGSPRFIDQPFANHNGGHLAFGPDGFLYIGLGDGGSGNDPDHRAQNPAELLGKMLRIDVNVPEADPTGYRVPSGNPFVGVAGTRPEIWSFGLRNPWRYTFDDPARGGTGALLIGDVGQNRWEEIDYEPPARGGRNYGWRNREGAHDNQTSRPPAFTAAGRSDSRIRPQRRPVDYRRLRVSRLRARVAVSRPVLLRRFRPGARVVAGDRRRSVDWRGNRGRPYRTHRSPGRQRATGGRSARSGLTPTASSMW